MVTLFCGMFGRKMNDGLVGGYLTALARYTDDEVRAGGQKAMEECATFPKPMDIIQRASLERKQTQKDYPLFGNEICHYCERLKYCIKDDETAVWECRQCYTGMTDAQIKAKFNEIMAKLGNFEKEVPF